MKCPKCGNIMKEVKLHWGLGTLLIERQKALKVFSKGKRIFAPSGKKGFECEKCKIVAFEY